MVGFEAPLISRVSDKSKPPVTIELAERYVDVLTGWAGIATATMQTLGSADQVRLERLHPSDGTIQTQWFESARVELDRED